MIWCGGVDDTSHSLKNIHLKMTTIAILAIAVDLIIKHLFSFVKLYDKYMYL